MNGSILHVDFSAAHQAPVLDVEILREEVVKTIQNFGQVEFAQTLVERSETQLLAA